MIPVERNRRRFNIIKMETYEAIYFNINFEFGPVNLVALLNLHNGALSINLISVSKCEGNIKLRPVSTTT